LVNRSGFDVVRDGFRFRFVFALQQHGVESVLDIGANVGQFGRDLRRAKFAGQILSVEPLREAYRQLGERMRAGLLNKYLRQVNEAARLVGAEISDAERQQRAEALRLAHLARARKALQDKARRRRQQRLEDAQRIYNEARRRAGLAPLAGDGGRCG